MNPLRTVNTLHTVTIVGVGLIGGSIGLALRQRNPGVKVIGVGSRQATLDSALELGAITSIAPSAEAAVADADLVVVCAPVDHIVDEVQKLARHCKPGTLITDAGSTKAAIASALSSADSRWPADVRFVGSHPLAGNEKKGPQHARAELFAGRTVVITPTSDAKPSDVQRLKAFWSGLGANVVQMSAAEHDSALAMTSHLPHLAAAAIAGATPERYVTLTAGGWQDTTRIAAGDPVLWRQIMLSNRENLLAALGQLTTLLDAWRAAIEAQDATELERLLTEAKRIRDAVGS
jgi:prephenate dehydrogenase